MLTKYQWTVYCGDEVVDIATDSEAAELLRIFKSVILNYETGIAQILEQAA